MSAEPHSFGRLARSGLPLLAGWLGGGHLKSRWGAPEAELALIAPELAAGTGADKRIICNRATPIGYVQDRDAAEAPEYHAPAGARMLDTFLAAEHLDQGDAGRYRRQRATSLLAGGGDRRAVRPRSRRPGIPPS